MFRKPARIIGKLRFKFLLRSILVLVIGVLGFETITLYQMGTMVRSLTLQNVHSTVTNATTKIDEELRQLSNNLSTIQILPVLEDYYLYTDYGLSNEANEYKQSLISFFNQQYQKNPEYLLIKVCNAQKKLLFSHQRNTGSASFTEKLPNNQATCLTQQKEQLIKITDNNQEKAVLVRSQDVFRKNQFLGTVLLYFDLTPSFEILAKERINQSGFLAVLDADAKLLSHVDKEQYQILMAAISQKNKNLDSQLSSIELDSERNYLFYHSSQKQIDWSIVAIIDEDEIFQPLYNQIKLAFVVLLTLIIFEILFLNFFTKKLITQRIRHLLDMTREILNGNYQYHLNEEGNDEISLLSKSFNQMSRSLQNQLLTLTLERSELAKSQQQLKDIIDNTSAIVIIKNLDGYYTLVNKAFEKYTQLDSKNVIGKNDQEIFPEELAKNFRSHDLEVIKKGQAINFEELASNNQGKAKTLLVIKFPLYDTNQEMYATCSIATDISQRIEEEQALQKINEKLTLSNTVLENIEEGVVVTNGDFIIVDVNPALSKLFGYTRKEMLGNKPSMFRSTQHDEEFFNELYTRLKTHGSWHGEIWEKTKRGKEIPQLLTITSIRDNSNTITHYAGIYSDISDLKQTEAKLQKLAHYDALTGLANRVLIEERTSQAILSAKRGNYKVTMLFIDLDNFKYINDTLGHDVGDKLLRKVAERFNALLRDTDTLARQGGDEFVVLLSKTMQSEDASIIATKIKAAGSAPFQVDEHELYISTSIGISVFPDDAANTSELLKCADMAMYAAKESGKNNFQFYSSALNHAAVDRLKIEKALRKAITDNQFQVYYQPQINTTTDKIEKVEALIRWKQPDGQYIAPDLFIPIAEESGLIIALGEWVVDKAAKDISDLNKKLKIPVGLSMNLSARQFRHHGLAIRLRDLVEQHNLSINMIEFEITEGLLVEDFQLAEHILIEFKEIGFSVALDDFGKGYSSLSYLKHFPIDTLKLDKIFMHELEVDRRNQAIVSASANLGFALDMKIVCEGIETKAQYDLVKSIGEVSVQGYYCSKALPLEELTQYILSHSCE